MSDDSAAPRIAGRTFIKTEDQVPPPQKKEAVDHPQHYGGKENVYEHIKVCDAWGLNYRLGNATKYIARAGKKTADPVEDLEKARWYLDSEIQRLKAIKAQGQPQPPA